MLVAIKSPKVCPCIWVGSFELGCTTIKSGMWTGLSVAMFDVMLALECAKIFWTIMCLQLFAAEELQQSLQNPDLSTEGGGPLTLTASRTLTILIVCSCG